MTRRLTRRELLRLAAAGFLAGCGPRPEVQVEPSSTVASATATPTAEPVTPTASPATATPAPKVTASPAALKTPTVTASATSTPTEVASLAGPGVVVRARHGGVWREGTLAPEHLQDMLDASVMVLTGLSQAEAAWATLFAPEERIAIKVNTIASSSFWTHVSLVMALAERLQSIGIPGEQIVIFDRQTRELESAGYPVNRDGSGLRCYGTDGAYTRDWTLLDAEIGISDVLLSCDALINVPLLKAHGTSGMSFALKNHYGTFDQPARFHRSIEQALGALNVLPPIAERTRLTVGDTLSICTRGWHDAVTGDAILVSLDPVAHDSVGVEMLEQAIVAGGGNSTVRERTASWLAHAADLGLGVAAPDAIDIVELDLGG